MAIKLDQIVSHVEQVKEFCWKKLCRKKFYFKFLKVHFKIPPSNHQTQLQIANLNSEKVNLTDLNFIILCLEKLLYILKVIKLNNQENRPQFNNNHILITINDVG